MTTVAASKPNQKIYIIPSCFSPLKRMVLGGRIQKHIDSNEPTKNKKWLHSVMFLLLFGRGGFPRQSTKSTATSPQRRPHQATLPNINQPWQTQSFADCATHIDSGKQAKYTGDENQARAGWRGWPKAIGSAASFHDAWRMESTPALPASSS